MGWRRLYFWLCEASEHFKSYGSFFVFIEQFLTTGPKNSLGGGGTGDLAASREKRTGEEVVEQTQKNPLWTACFKSSITNVVLTTWGNYTSRAGLQVKTKHPVSNDAGKHSSPNNPYFKLNSLWLVIIRSKRLDDHTPTSNQCHRTASPFQMWSRTVFLYQDTKQIHATARTHLDLHYLKFGIKMYLLYICNYI